MVDAAREQQRAGAGSDRQLQARIDFATRRCSWRRNAVERRRAQHRSAAQAIRYIINKHFDPEHVGGNEKLRRRGRLSPRQRAGNIADAAEGAAILAHENVLQRMTTPAPANRHAGGCAADRHLLLRHDELSHFFNGEG